VRYAIDAIHMIAIVEPQPKDQIEWNLKGIALAESDPLQKGWLLALLKNIGESYLTIHNYELACESFERLAQMQRGAYGEPDKNTVKDISKSLRLANNPEEALELLQPVLDKLLSEGQDDGYLRQEIAESNLDAGRANESKMHFARAYELLSPDDWIRKNEQETLVRLKKLSL
jgi:hypothetical protein